MLSRLQPPKWYVPVMEPTPIWGARFRTCHREEFNKIYIHYLKTGKVVSREERLTEPLTF